MEKQLYIKQLRPELYLMDEAHESTGYLVIGKDKACLIDTMNGYNDLHKTVREITDKPVIVINTHGHPDHIFGNVFFDRAFLHADDFALAQSFCNDKKMSPFEPITQGDVIDLGGKHLEVYSLPGHTRGSILLLLKEERILFTGDAVNHHVWMQLEGCPSMTQFVKNLDQVMFLEKEADFILHGHARKFDDISLMHCVRQGALEISEGDTLKDEIYPWFGGTAKQHHFKLEEGKQYSQLHSVICYNDVTVS